MAAATPARRSVSGEVAEKDLALAFARELQDKLVERGRVRVALTREDDRYLTLEQRAAVARAAATRACSSRCTWTARPIRSPAARASIRFPTSPRTPEAARFAALENRGALAAGDSSGSVRAILSDLAMRSRR